MFLHKLASYSHLVGFFRIAFAIALLLANSAYAEEKSLTVTVIDQNGQPIEDVVVIAATENPSTKPASMHRAIMDQQSKQFQPRVLIVNTGTEVTFPNSDKVRHHVYSFSDPKRFEIKLYAGAPNEPVYFDTAGIVVLGCNIHDNMVGYIIVSDSPYFSKTNADGKAALTSDGKEPVKLQIWHSLLDDPTSPVIQDNIEWSPTGEIEIQISIQAPATQTKTKTKTSRFR